MSLRAELFSGGTAEWDDFVRATPGWTHFHLHGWKAVVERVFGHECVYLAAREPSGALAGVLPLVRVHGPLGHYLVSMPFVNLGGPLGSADAARLLVQTGGQIARARRVRLLELRSRVPLEIDLPVSHRKVTVLLDLPVHDPAPLWNQFKAKVRSQIRRPQKEGATVRFGSDQLDPFYRVYSRHMRDLGTPAQSRQLFSALAETFPDTVQFGCVYLGNEPVAAGCGFEWGSEFEMSWAASLKRYSAVAPNMLLYWCFMERCIEQGHRVFNFGRCTPGSGTHRFKLQWGSREEPLWWYRLTDRAEAATPSADDRLYSLGSKLWRRLPLGLANAVGPRIVQYAP